MVSDEVVKVKSPFQLKILDKSIGIEDVFVERKLIIFYLMFQ